MELLMGKCLPKEDCAMSTLDYLRAHDITTEEQMLAYSMMGKRTQHTFNSWAGVALSIMGERGDSAQGPLL